MVSLNFIRILVINSNKVFFDTFAQSSLIVITGRHGCEQHDKEFEQPLLMIMYA